MDSAGCRAATLATTSKPALKSAHRGADIQGMAIALRAPARITPIAPIRPSLHIVPHADPVISEHPDDWMSIDDVIIGLDRVDRVTVGPNGVFVVVIDPEPARLTSEGVVRDGDRVKEPVKRALRAAHELGKRLSLPGAFAYPVLLTGRGIAPGYLGRLRVVRVDQFAEALWCHPGRPLTRTERAAVASTVRDMTAPAIL